MSKTMNIKYSVNLRLKARIDERATRGSLLSQGAYHWPLESLEYTYAWAALEIVLLHSDKANHIYNDILNAWELPGCHVFIDAFRDLPVTKEWIAQKLKALEKGEPLPDWPIEWLDIYFKHAPIYYEGESHNTDWEYLLNKMNELILLGFNRPADQAEETWKMIPDTSPLLKSVIIFRSQAEYAGVKIEDLTRYRPAILDGKPYDLNTIMAEKPTSGPERKIYRALVDTYQQYKFKIMQNAKLLKDADQWYKCRMNLTFNDKQRVLFAMATNF